jgi:hypothetical protein
MKMLDKTGAFKSILDQGRAAALRTGQRLLGELKEVVESNSALSKVSQAALSNQGPEPPIVARLVVEIRSDGSRTVARGALEDSTTNQKVAVLAEGTSPAQLAASLAKSLLALPLFATSVARSLRRTGVSDISAPDVSASDRTEEPRR